MEEILFFDFYSGICRKGTIPKRRIVDRSNNKKSDFTYCIDVPRFLFDDILRFPFFGFFLLFFFSFIYIYIYTFQFLSRWSLSNQLGPIIVLGVNLRVFCTVLLSAENYSIMCRVSVLLS